jgi:hypothetical protein
MATSLNRPEVDAAMRDLVGHYVRAFRGRVRACYVIGSYAEGTAVPVSDADFVVIFRDAFRGPEEQAAAQRLSQDCASAFPVRLDVILGAETALDQLHTVLRVALKLGSVLLYGDDLRAELALPPHAEYRWALRHGALRFVTLLRGQDNLPALPLAYPHPGDEFFGYTRVRIAGWYPAGVSVGTKELVAAATRIAAAQVAAVSELYVPGKRQAVSLYRQRVGQPWAAWLEQILEECQQRWHYAVPVSAAERAALRALCARMLAFENAFVEGT